MKPHYTKCFSSPEEIVSILKNERGMLFVDERKAVRYLNNISYQRLVPYIYPFYKYPKSDLQLKPNTTFEKVLSLYRFDKKLRMLLFNEIEKIEVSIRCVMANYGCQQLQDDYWISSSVHHADEDRFKETLKIIRKELKDSKEDMIVHFRDTYSETFPPAWMITEVLYFGNLNCIYSNIANHKLRKSIADYYGMKPKVFTSWLTVLVNLRNMCCHHSRIWNRDYDIRPTIPRTLSNPWLIDSEIDGGRLYFRVCIIKYFLNVVSPGNDMTNKLDSLIHSYPQIDISAMGFPKGWQEEPLWKW